MARDRVEIRATKGNPPVVANVWPKSVHETTEGLRASKINSQLPTAQTSAVARRGSLPAGIGGSMISNTRNTAAVSGTGIPSRMVIK
jgi:hypothetical protein